MILWCRKGHLIEEVNNVNSKALYDAMKAKGIPVGKMCELLNMSRSAFYRKTRGKTEFTLGEIQKICEVLNLPSPVGIFFAQTVS